MTGPTLTSKVTSGWVVWVATVLGILVIGFVDFLSGTEVRVFPLYFLPISLTAWYSGRAGALAAAALAAVSWLASNYMAGLHYSHPAIWVANTIVQATSFATVGFLVQGVPEHGEEERDLSRTDPLTSLLNSRAFYEEAARILALCRRKRRPATLAYVDLDNFKAINDTLGHQAGDAVLRSVAGLLRETTRQSDLCARLGGDEFAILLAESDPSQAAVALERLRVRLSDRVASDTGLVTCSIGAVTFLVVPESLEEMVSAADSRMYLAKTEGRNRLHLETAEIIAPGADPGLECSQASRSIQPPDRETSRERSAP